MPSNYNAINTPLFRRIPEGAHRILDVGCDTGLLGAAIKERNKSAYVVGIEMIANSAKEAKSRLDEVYVLNIEHDDLTILGGQFDAIVFGDVLEHLYDPEICLRRLRPLLSKTGKVYACIPNMQHYTIFRSLLRGDFQYQRLGLLDRTHIRFYTLANIMKLFLDAGFIPKKTGRLANEKSDVSEILSNTISELGYSELNAINLNTFQYLFEAAPMKRIPDQVESSGLTFVVCCNNDDVFHSNLRASPLFKSGKHQLIVKRNMSSAAEGYNAGFSEAHHENIVFVSQDVYLPEGWDAQLECELAVVKARTSDWVYGCIGAKPAEGGKQSLSGVVIDRDSTLDYIDSPGPLETQTLDELLLVLPANSALRFDSDFNFHLYGADICMQNLQKGGLNFAGYSPCFHNSQLYGSSSPHGFGSVAKQFSEKWKDVPSVTTPCLKLDHKDASSDGS